MSRWKAANEALRSLQARQDAWNDFDNDVDAMEASGEFVGWGDGSDDWGDDDPFGEQDIFDAWDREEAAIHRQMNAMSNRRAAYRERGCLLRAQRTMRQIAERGTPPLPEEYPALRDWVEIERTKLPRRLKTESKSWPWLRQWRERRASRKRAAAPVACCE